MTQLGVGPLRRRVEFALSNRTRLNWNPDSDSRRISPDSLLCLRLDAENFLLADDREFLCGATPSY